MSPQPPAPRSDEEPCRPCRGTGQIMSNLGGAPNSVPCPWCDGTGRFISGHDAQLRGGDVIAEPR